MFAYGNHAYVLWIFNLEVDISKMFYLVVICLNSVMVAFILVGVEKMCIPDNYPFIPGYSHLER